jgi:hypothetical protein
MVAKIVYIDKNGKRSNRPPDGVPPFIPKPPVDGSGISIGDGIPCNVNPDFEVKKRAKSKEEI